MQLEDYFDFLAEDDIRIKGSRVGIETVLYDHIYRNETPEEIQQHYPTITVEQAYATILYYLQNPESVGAYMTEWLDWGRRMREEQERNPSPAILRLRALKAQQDKEKEALMPQK